MIFDFDGIIEVTWNAKGKQKREKPKNTLC